MRTLEGIIYKPGIGRIGWEAAGPATFNVWILRGPGKLLLGTVKLGGDQSAWGTLAPTLGVIPTTVGPVATIDEVVERMVARWQELRSAEVRS